MRTIAVLFLVAMLPAVSRAADDIELTVQKDAPKTKAKPPEGDAKAKIQKEVRGIYGKSLEDAKTDDEKTALASMMRGDSLILDRDDERFVVLESAAIISKNTGDLDDELLTLDVLAAGFDLPKDLLDRRKKLKQDIGAREANKRTAAYRADEAKKRRILDLEKRVRTLMETLGAAAVRPADRAKTETDDDYIARLDKTVKQMIAALSTQRGKEINERIAARQDAANADFNKRFQEAKARSGQ